MANAGQSQHWVLVPKGDVWPRAQQNLSLELQCALAERTWEDKLLPELLTASFPGLLEEAPLSRRKRGEHKEQAENKKDPNREIPGSTEF